MKKHVSFLFFLIILLSFSLCYATPFPDKNNLQCVKWTYSDTTSGNDTTFYYAPSLTSISPEGILETWIKITEKDFAGDITNISIKHDFVNQNFEKIKTTESLEYDKSGFMLSDREYSNNINWTNMPLGTPLETTLLNAYQSAKDNQKNK